jgi:hypothetical protein
VRYKRAHILLPEDLAREIDAVAGSRGRSAFFIETAWDAIRRRKLLKFLKSEEPVWRDANHPELKEGSAKWVKGLRQESDNNRRPSRKRRKK